MHKVTSVKDEVEKLLKIGFIYLISLMQWVFNPIPFYKKQGTIRVCTDFRDLNKVCPKDNYPMPFIDQIMMLVRVVNFFRLWMVFSDTIKFKSSWKTNIK